MKDSIRADLLEGYPHYAELTASLEKQKEQFFKATDNITKEKDFKGVSS